MRQLWECSILTLSNSKKNGSIILCTSWPLFAIRLCRLLPARIARASGCLWLQVTERYQFTVGQLVVWGLLVVVVQALDYVTPILGTKYSGGSKWGNWGCVLGTVAGIFLFVPWGILLGPFLGALVGELLGGKAFGEAMKAGLGAFLGFVVSVVLKVGLCGYFVYCEIAFL